MDHQQASRWSFLDKFSPELFSFGFDPEILTLFWGLFRSGNDIIPTPRIIPSAPFRILVPFHATEGASALSVLHSGFTTGGIFFVATLGSYGVYFFLQSAREKFLKPGSDTELEGADNSGQLSPVTQHPIRPTTLNVGSRSVPHGSKHGFLSFPGLRRGKQLREIDLNLDDIEDMGDIQGEYFGPANIEDCLDDSAGSSDFQTPCA
ncbi:unnamed protein product [Allacma fusca]|uniref:Uncharacterized protein n=1 Tax=Allacma fusca TaxID=39272 RepID=A0A8J2JHP5_9HEXA|nr:unnamed protein product [Allacma fusca]